MKLTTVVAPGGTRAARVEGDVYVLLPFPDLVSLLARPDWREVAGSEGAEAAGIEGAEAAGVEGAEGAGVEGAEAGGVEVGTVPAVRPAQILCVGLNYRSHILESGAEIPEYPTLFAKFPASLTGPASDILLPAASHQVDWEAELGVVVGRRAKGVSVEEAAECIGGFTAVNDVSMRDWQHRTTEWLQGKNFERSTPVGPVIVTPDEVDGGRDLSVTCHVDGRLMQDARTSDLLFTPAQIISYASTFMTLEPGDLIATGTPAGVAAARPDKPFLRDGQTVTVTVEGVGSCVNVFREKLGD